MDARHGSVAPAEATGTLGKHRAGAEDAGVYRPILSGRYLTPLTQPDGSGTCTTTAIAMIAGCTIDQSIAASALSQPSKGTYNHEATRALRHLGVKYGRWTRNRRNIPKFCLCTLENNRGTWMHSVAVLDGLVYDPLIGWPIPVRVYSDFILDSYSKNKGVGPVQWHEFLPIKTPPPGYRS